MARFKTRRLARYNTLVNKYHFLKSEAAELSRIKKHVPPSGGVRQYPPAMLALQRSRLAMWANYKQWVGKEAWLELSEREIKDGWSNRIRKFYERERLKSTTDKKTGLSIAKLTNWIVRKDVHGNKIPPSPSVWDWYDSVFQRLPDEQKWDTPRSHRTGQVEVKVDKVLTQRWIADLRKSIAQTDNPERKAQLRDQIANLHRSLKR